ncbi:MAG: hypothetical protein HY459_00315 [Parcubacteria group bacterium]|nr:hypothetical protein [Parcubacteria group bacterium]
MTKRRNKEEMAKELDSMLAQLTPRERAVLAFRKGQAKLRKERIGELRELADRFTDAELEVWLPLLRQRMPQRRFRLLRSPTSEAREADE